MAGLKHKKVDAPANEFGREAMLDCAGDLVCAKTEARWMSQQGH
jgi:hypothetical protein